MKKKMLCLTIVLISMTFASGCGKKEQESQPEKTAMENSAQKAAARTIDSSTAGMISGRVVFKGGVPQARPLPIEGNPECKVFHSGKLLDESVLVEDGGLQNVFVYIKEGLEDVAFDPPKTPVKLDQSKCVYVPRVTGVQVSQPLVLINSDPTLHNVHAYQGKDTLWNLGMPFEGMEITKTFAKPEIMVALKCDLHPWMRGYVGVLPHPCFDVSDPGGAFEIRHVPPGKYVVEAWHETFGTRTQTVQIDERGEKEISFEFGA